MENEYEKYQYSVLMSVYEKDNDEYLSMAIESMLNQTVKPEQFVLVKDGSVTVAVDAIIQAYEKNNPGLFTVVELKHNCGLPTALNEGLKYCRNELVARMDADDISLEQRCEKEISLFRENKDLVICGCNIDEFYNSPENIKTSRIVPESYEDILRFLRRRTPFNHPTVMYKKSKVLENGGYSPEIKRKQDYDLFSRMLINGCYARNVNESLLLFRANDDNYARRKSGSTLKNAFVVYWRHYKRGGCRFLDYAVMCAGELFLFILPIPLMRVISDLFLRKSK